MLRITALRRSTFALLLAGSLGIAAPAAADPAPAPPDTAAEEEEAPSVQLQTQIESLLCTVLAPLCGLLDGDGEGDGEEGSSMDPHGLH